MCPFPAQVHAPLGLADAPRAVRGLDRPGVRAGVRAREERYGSRKVTRLDATPPHLVTGAERIADLNAA
jgi:hypothetical protein